MECGKLTAKLRDAVPVCLMVNGMEIRRYRNIEIPDVIKKLPFTDFKFDVPVVGAITFKIVFATGVLPDPMPEPRGLKSHKPVTDEPTALAQAISAIPTDVVPPAEEELHPADALGETMDTRNPIAVGVTEALDSDHKAITAEQPKIMEIAYHATGERRKELVKAISQFTGLTATFQNAPTFAYSIGIYTVDKGGTLTGENNTALVESLVEQGFIAD